MVLPDSELRVSLSDGAVGVIIGNPHTFRGRFEVAVSETESRSCSLHEVVPMTEAARWWLDGYMSAMEPPPWDVLADDYDPGMQDDDPQIQRWRDVVRQFRETGHYIGDVDG